MISENFFLINKSGLKLECQIDRDETKTKQPLIFIAGGFGAGALKGYTQPALTKLFLKHNFAVFRMNFPGNENSDGDSAFATITAGLGDINIALDYIKNLDWVEYLALVGNSYGGGLVIHEVAEKLNHNYKFLILLSPRIDTKCRYEDDKNIDLNNWEKNEFITINGQKLHYSMYSDALNYHPWDVAKNINIPTLIVHSDADEICPYEQSVRLHKIIKESEMVTIHGIKHQFRENIDTVVNIIDKWLNKNINDKQL